ncbi:hypothetical protein EBU24_00010 [bacterium]|nr:hypothetical protein [bacterium]
MEIAIVVNKIRFSQLSYLLTKQSEDNDLVVFSQNDYTINANNGFSIFMMYDFWNYKGKNIVATDIDSCRLILKNPSVKSFYFYVWDLEWMRLPPFDYEEIQKIYGNKKIKLIARSNRHAIAIEQAWNKKCLIVEDFNLNEIFKGEKSESVNA